MSDSTAFHIERDEASAAYFDGARAGQLLIRSCAACGRLFPPQQRRCPDGTELAWFPVDGAATLITWAVDRAAPASPALLNATGDGSVIGIVELAEGPWLNTALPGVDATMLAPGMAMQVSFLQLGDGEPVPVFVPAP
ncbi:MAG: OB-fold domain-containing protein [Ilumatobacteraceae bacterium]